MTFSLKLGVLLLLNHVTILVVLAFLINIITVPPALKTRLEYFLSTKKLVYVRNNIWMKDRQYVRE